MENSWLVSVDNNLPPFLVEFKKTSGGGYVLQIATENILGGVKPYPKKNGHTQVVSIDEEGRLWTTSNGVNIVGVEISNGELMVTDSNNKTYSLGKIDSLPTVTDSDNGSFLRVVNGAWNVAKLAQAEEVSF